MRLTDPAFILLALLCGVIWLFGGPANKAVKEAEMDLTADELKTFRERYAKASKRHDMPVRFEVLAKAQARASRIWLLSAAAVTGTIVWIILAGPGLGLVDRS